MTAYTSLFPGAPRSGFFSVNDSVVDSNGVTWMCVVGGYGSDPSFGGSSAAVFSAMPSVLPVTAVGNGAVAGTTATVVERGMGGVHQSTISFTALPQTITNGASEFTSTKVYDFPEGRILVLGVTATLQQTTTSVLATTITTGTSGAVALGTVASSNASLTGTMVNLLPSTAFTSSTTIAVAGTAVTAALAASAQFDGTTTPVDMLLNTSIATNSADGTLTWLGTIVCTWVNLGDY